MMEGKKFKFSFHIVFVIVLVVISVIVGIRLVIWNKGVDSTYDPDEINTAFDIEPLDVLFSLNPKKLEGREDDGVLTILCLGNNVITDGRPKNESFSDFLGAGLNANVINAGFSNSLVTYATLFDEPVEDRDVFCFYRLTQALVSGDFTGQEKALNGYEDSFAGETLSKLKELDMETVDMMVVFYDARDMIEFRPTRSMSNDEKVITPDGMDGSLVLGIRAIQEKYPFIRIVLMSPYYAFARLDSGEYFPLASSGYGPALLSDYLGSVIHAATATGVSAIDNFYGTINELNFDKYLTNNIDINKDGRKLLADRLIKTLNLKPSN